MIKTIAILLTCFCVSLAHTTATEEVSKETASRLYGTWRSDAVATNAYLLKYAKLNDQQREMLPNLFGKAVINFNPDGSGSIEMAKRVYPKKEGGEIEFPARKTDFTFMILGESQSQIVIKSTSNEKVFQSLPFAILKLHDDNTYSVSLSDSISEINGREFFKRVKNPESGTVEDRDAE